ncbi:unnamed protein product [Aureobasidium pullulans]|nr:unnamed protein product [Aureobasidium pullulans]CAC9890131.1 unnamed protein product [Aureobasidium pullulans]CAD0029633.1 unnamed protein product [Aureobasidium pullulans]
MPTQPSQTPAETSQSSALLSLLDNTFPFESQSDYYAPLTTLAATSEIHVPTEFQRPDDFQSTAARADTSRTVGNIDYYKDIDWSRLQWQERDGTRIKLEACNNGLGSSKSWIFNYGWRVQQQGVLPEVYFWVCKTCHKKKAIRSAFTCGNGTAPPTKHLLKTHDITVHGVGEKRSRLSSSFAASSTKSSNHGQDIERFGTVFHHASWKARVVAWICHDNQAFQMMESSYLQDMLLSLNPAVGKRGCLPNHSSVVDWIEQAYTSHLGIVTEKLHAAQSKIHLSFDLWSSRNLRALLGINCHFADEFGNLKTFLLSLPEQSGPHSGINIANNVAAIINHFDLADKIGYFMTDNATNNDTCIEALGTEFGFNPLHRRLRCSGHKINLVARAMLWGVDEEAFENELAHVTIEDQDLLIWRRRGPLGKMRNTIIWIRSSPQRNEAFKQLQREHPLIDQICELHVPNDTRWNSMWDAIVVFIKLRPVVEEFYQKQQSLWQDYWNKITDFNQKPPPQKHRKKPAQLDDHLSQDDWSILSIYNQLLEPLYHATQRLEGRGGGASHGAIWQAAKTEYSVVRPSQDYSMFSSQASTVYEDSQPSQGALQDLDKPAPLTRFNLRRNQASQPMQPPPLPPKPSSPRPPPAPAEPLKNSLEYRMLCVGVNLAWKKLDEYYQKTDQSPVYVAAVVLHPGLKWKYIEKVWRDRPAWIVQARRNVEDLWQEYASLPITEEDKQSAMVEDNARWMDDDMLSEFSDVGEETNDEYIRWNEEGRLPKEFRPLEFWSTKRQRETYPRLSKMARDLFTIPAMSDEPERVFSSAGLMVTPLRGKLSARAIGQTQCVKSWIKTGIITRLEASFELVNSVPQEAE